MHMTNDSSLPFYIGKGAGNRAWQLNPARRSLHWRRVVNKHGCKVQVLSFWEREEDAMTHERFLIKVFSEIGIPLVNKTEGGDGTSGFRWSDESKQRLSSILKGKPKSDRHKASLKAAERRVTQKVIEARLSKRGRKPAPSVYENFLTSIKAKPVCAIGTDFVFRTAAHAVRWLQQNGKTKAQSSPIHRSCKQGSTAYGYKWSYKE